jgi:NAD(P)-dependent dehydrogenase (short-subunit alcohol dehydrogenase family)
MPSRSVLITGCSSGIGWHAARALRERGYHVIASARRLASVEQLAADGFDTVQLDLASSGSIQRAVARVEEITQGQLYALFNNGGYGQPGAVEDLTRDALREQFETLVFGWHELTRALLPGMIQRGEGRIVQNSSVLGFVAMPYRGAYNAAKFAIEGLTDTLRLELAGTGVFISLIEPGPIESAFRSHALAAFHRHVDAVRSRHQAAYARQAQRLAHPGSPSRFALPASAVVAKLTRALESPCPAPRYAVTLPTHVFAVLKRLLPTRTLDKLLSLAGGGGRR